jgi:isoamylase
VALFYNGGAITDRDRRGRVIRDDSFLLFFNAGEAAVEFVVPPVTGCGWRSVIDTSTVAPPERARVTAGCRVEIEPSALMVWQAHGLGAAEQPVAGVVSGDGTSAGDEPSAA